MPAPATPTINTGLPGSDLAWEIDHTDEFNDLTTTFQFNNMTEALHQVGRKYTDADGNIIGDTNAPGRRWSAFYDDHQSTVTRIENNQLVMGGLFTPQNDFGSVDYILAANVIEMRSNRVYTSFLESSTRVYSNLANGGAGGHIIDPASPDIYVEPGCFIQFDINFTETVTQAFRWSAYLLPRVPNESLSYDADPSNGVEIDFPEFESSPGFEGYLQQKVIAGAGGQTPNGSVDVLTNFGIDVSTGWHTMGLLWLDDILVWYVDGVETQRDEVRVPQVPHYIVFSREANTGAKEYFTDHNPAQTYNTGDYVTQGNFSYRANSAIAAAPFNVGQWTQVSYVDPADVGQPASNLVAVRPYIPPDPGLFANHWWFDRNSINTDVTRIDYLRTWRVSTPSARKISMKPLISTGLTVEASVDNPQTGEFYQWNKTRPDSEITIERTDSSTAIIRAVGDVSTDVTGQVSITIGTAAFPSITTPDVLDSSIKTFIWGPGGQTVDAYQFTLGSTPGGTEYHDSGETTGTAIANNVPFPNDGTPVYARLRYLIGTTWSEIDRLYDGYQRPFIVTPVKSTTLPTTDFIVGWDMGTIKADAYRVSVGTTADHFAYYTSGTLTSPSATVSNTFPTDGGTVVIKVQYRDYGESFTTAKQFLSVYNATNI